MTDYSQWLESVKMGHGGLIPLLIVFVLAIGGTIALNFMSDRIGDTRFGVSAVLASTLLLVFIIVGMLVKFCLPPKDTPSFAQRTGQVFGVERIVCDYGCPVYGLPEDRTSANWMQDGKLVHGTIIVDGHKVGLAGPDGELLKPVKR